MAKKHSKLIIAFGIAGLIALFSVWLAKFTVGSDFPVFYTAASKLVGQATPNSEIYSIAIENNYLPEQVQINAFIYSMPVAYILSPLAFLPYYAAKSVMIFISITCYLFSIVIILRMNCASGRWLFYPLVLSFLWLPFIQDIRSAQVNSIILLLVSVAVYFAVKERVFICGALLSLAALFKLFPLAIAMALGLKNWRIFAGFAVIFASSFLIPGSAGWFTAISNIYQADLMPLYLLTSRFGLAWFGLYVITLAGLTALIIYRTNNNDYPLLVSFIVPAAFLIMPVLEYYHLTLLMFSYIYIFTSKYKEDRLLVLSAIISFVTISIAFFYSRASVHFVLISSLSKALVTAGLVLLWGALAFRLTDQKNRVFRKLQGRERFTSL